MTKDIEAFIDRYVKEIRENNVALFIGAGFSKNSGYVDWKNLLKDIANELELNIDKETDFVTLAQYYYNANQNRSVINNIIFEEFSQDKEIDENHKILAKLPIFTYWTTNYDSLIEDSLKSIQKIVDVKHTNKQLSITKSRREAIVYKMHGDRDNPDDTIILKDDYERYYREYAPFIATLNGDLISKTFLFIGFSFYDPNIDYILSRVRVEYGSGNSRQHYSIMRKPKKSEFSEEADYDYTKRKFDLFTQDLKRYNIKALLIDEYGEITEILKIIERRLNSSNIFISGSAASYGTFQQEEAISFVHTLSKRLIQEGFNLISGFGVGIGSAVITGALEEIYMKSKTIHDDRLILRPFPQGIQNDENRKQLWTSYREDMISRAGITVILFGNKSSNTDEILYADGVRTEYEIARKHGNLIVPVGCTGFVAEEIWNIVNDNMIDFYPNIDEDLKEAFQLLNIKNECNSLVENVTNFIRLLRRK